jgi:tetratricopeptide (TPR) repeat protein
MPKKAAPKTEKKPAQKTEAKEETIKAIFTQINDRMASFENCEREGELKPFDYVGVISLLEMVLAIDPQNREATNFKGMMYVGMGENAKAVECFDRLLALNPADKEALNNKGIALYGLGKDKEALKYVDKAIELDSRYSDALMNKAVILHGMGKDKEAETLMSKARALYAING